MTEGNEHLLRYCIIGSNTKVNHKFGNLTADHKWDTNYLPTLGYDIPTKRIMVDKDVIKLILTILAGEEFFGRWHSRYYRGASAGIILFEKNDREAYLKVTTFYKEFKKAKTSPVPVAVVGIIANTEEISEEEGEQLAKQLNCRYFETELTNKKQIEHIFRVLAKQAIEK